MLIPTKFVVRMGGKTVFLHYDDKFTCGRGCPDMVKKKRCTDQCRHEMVAWFVPPGETVLQELLMNVELGVKELSKFLSDPTG